MTCARRQSKVQSRINQHFARYFSKLGQRSTGSVGCARANVETTGTAFSNESGSPSRCLMRVSFCESAEVPVATHWFPYIRKILLTSIGLEILHFRPWRFSRCCMTLTTLVSGLSFRYCLLAAVTQLRHLLWLRCCMFGEKFDGFKACLHPEHVIVSSVAFLS